MVTMAHLNGQLNARSPRLNLKYIQLWTAHGTAYTGVDVEARAEYRTLMALACGNVAACGLKRHGGTLGVSHRERVLRLVASSCEPATCC